MTNQLTLRSLDIPSIHKFGIGFDNIFDELMRVNAQQSNTNYPPYNIVKHSEDLFDIELAVAGFGEGEIDITLERNVLTIKGDRNRQNLNQPKADTQPEYIHQGIGGRRFSREFTLAEHVEVSGATIVNGILTINLERRIPEADKPKTIAITYQK